MSNGFQLGSVYDFTPDQLSMFVRTTSMRRNAELMTEMNVKAAATSAAYSGDTKPLEAIEKAIYGTAVSHGTELQKRLRGFIHAARKAGVKVENGGS